MSTPTFELDPLAASFLTADVDLCRAEIARLDEDIKKLQAKRRAQEYKLSVLTAGARSAVSSSGAASGEPDAAGNGGTQPAKSGDPPAVGFREMIRAVLRDSNKGMKPKDIAKSMLDRGLNYSRTTQLNTRISNDLRRLVQSGSVRRSRGFYYIHREASNGAA